jgi:flagellar hook assembly protein FlgD
LDRNEFEARPGTTMEIRCLLGTSRSVALRVYNVRGAVVRHLWDGPMPEGPSIFSWDGRDDLGQRVATGLYLVAFESGGKADIKKLVVIRR